MRPETFNKFYRMYAIVDIASQQFKVEAGMEIFVNRLKAGKGAEVEFDKVLLVENEGAVKVGAPYVEGAVVKATVLDDEAKAKKYLKRAVNNPKGGAELLKEVREEAAAGDEDAKKILTLIK